MKDTFLKYWIQSYLIKLLENLSYQYYFVILHAMNWLIRMKDIYVNCVKSTTNKKIKKLFIRRSKDFLVWEFESQMDYPFSH